MGHDTYNVPTPPNTGDHVKCGFPQASAVTLLTLGLLQYKDVYKASAQLDEMYDCIRWPLEWLLKCHTGENELYIQVGDGNLDHNFSGRPEDMTMARPSFKNTSDKPGSDVAGSDEYKDEMAVGAAVLYLATNNTQYFTDAESFHQHGNQWGQS
ncbi:Hypothetical predicted protein [Mytilus galloprovincialis]|uniref:cellulase n=1 Tax=Mytilus galloprovincialis TaxID=29158 RepID=A0A8B6EYU2_MYTGA|nr:Hypothetical predicted protein [Mytilus galloprovincialis]